MKPAIISTYQEEDKLNEVPFESASAQLHDREIDIGPEAQVFLDSAVALAESDISGIEAEQVEAADLDQDKFFSGVKKFYVAVVKGIIKRFPWKDSTLRDLVVLNPDLRQTAGVSRPAMHNLAARFPLAIPPADTNTLFSQFSDYQVAAVNELPTYQDGDRLDVFWSQMAKVTTPMKVPRYNVLARFMLVLLTLPHSNASCERLFSMVRKIMTENRTSLANDTLDALLSCKVNGPDCLSFQPSQQVLRAAKSATMEYIKSHEKKQSGSVDNTESSGQ